MVIKTGFLRALPIGLQPIPRQGDQHHIFEQRLLANLPGHLKTAQPRQANVQQHHLRLPRQRRFQRTRATVRHAALMAGQVQQHGYGLCGIDVVIDDQHPTGFSTSLNRLGQRRRLRQKRSWRDRQAHDKLATLPQHTEDLDASAVKR